MKIYNYNPITGEYINEGIADESPLEQGVYLIPANATNIELNLIIKKNEVACFSENKWVCKSDFRGETYYDKITGEEIIINFIGDIPENLQKEKPIIHETLTQLKDKLNKKTIDLFEQALKEPLQVADVYVLGEWANTYTNTYVALLTDLEDGVLDTVVNILVLLPNGLLKEELIETMEEFKPYYNTVKNDYKTKVTKRNSYLVQIQNAQTIEELEAIIIEYGSEQNSITIESDNSKINISTITLNQV